MKSTILPKLPELETLLVELEKIKEKWDQSVVAWIGWCDKCKKWRVHANGVGISYHNPTCSFGHYSPGKSVKIMITLLNKLLK